jgi:HlyD family secretion protein
VELARAGRRHPSEVILAISTGKVVWRGSLLILAAAAAYGVFVWTRPTPVKVNVRPVERGWVESTVANTRAGTVKACHRAKLAPQAGGQVSRLLIREGTRVKEGDVLVEIWNDDLRASLALAKSEETASAARAEQSCLTADLAEREAVRARQLFDSKVLDEQGLDRAEAERNTSRAACKAARATADESHGRVQVAKAALDRTILRAPFDGIVAELNAEIGEVVIPSPPGIPTPPALDLIEEGCLYVIAPIDEIDARAVRPGQQARVTLDAFQGRTFAATVRRVAPYVLDLEKQARTLDVEVEIDDPRSAPDLLPGYSADVEILLERRENVLRVPAEAVSGEGRVLVLSGGTIEERKIESGIANWQFVEIRSGLAEGDQVVMSLNKPEVVPGAKAVAESGNEPTPGSSPGSRPGTRPASGTGG